MFTGAETALRRSSRFYSGVCTLQFVSNFNSERTITR